MTLVDTSAWVEYLRATGSHAHVAVRRILDRDEPLHTTDVVAMEVLAGGRDPRHIADLRRLLARCDHVPLQGLSDYEEAAGLYRQCRQAGETIRALTHCLIAVVAIRSDLPVLHCDGDFDALARRTKVRSAL